MNHNEANAMSQSSKSKSTSKLKPLKSSAPKVKTEAKSTQPSTVLFCLRTPGGELARRLKAKESELDPLLSHKIKVVEAGGLPLKLILWPSDPWVHDKSNRWECLIFNNKMLGEEKKRGNCFKRSVIYSNQCQLCKSKGVVAQYIGEPGKADLRDQRSIW